MSNSHPLFRDVATAIAHSNYHLRAPLVSELASLGIHTVSFFDGVADLEGGLKDVKPELIILELGTPIDDALDLARLVRLDRLGCHAYTVLVATTENTDQEFIVSALSAGFDDIIASPLNIKLVLDRLTHLLHSRKPFVLMENYIGPDRRFDREITGNRSDEPDLILPPNPLDRNGMNAGIVTTFTKAFGAVRSQYLAKFRAAANEGVCSELENLIENFDHRNITNDEMPLFNELMSVLNNYVEIMKTNKSKQFSDVDKQLLKLVNEISDNHREVWQADIGALQHLVKLIRHAHGNT